MAMPVSTCHTRSQVGSSHGVDPGDADGSTSPMTPHSRKVASRRTFQILRWVVTFIRLVR